MSQKEKISDTVISRLTQYHCILGDCIKTGTKTVTSFLIAQLLKIDDSQVRKDISILNNTGKSRVGYDVLKLKEAIEKTLGFSNPKEVFIIGAGNLGSALAKYNDFEDYGLLVKALFDVDKEKIGKNINNKPVLDIKELPFFTAKTNVEICILTVPKDNAQATADFAVKSKIRYIWNFSPTVLVVPSGVEVWNENLMGNFLRFSYKIAK
ncbi:MAG: redox-sensing transcriptional repressor Rex [Candidatus Gastranaerophilales bacterium]|nr:redox-sensing transcriptional repressor Rex [Candidatus Gastranaerophilales bacterium]